jgi:FkbM family methyltransferase
MYELKRYIGERPAIYRALEILGARRIYQAVRNTEFYLKLSGVKRIDVAGVEMLFTLQDAQSRIFFNHPFFLGELYEREVTHHLVNRLKESKCFVDVGANMGFYSVLAGKILSSRGGVVHAIEMDAENVNRIRANLRLNGLRNVTIHEIALGDHHGTVEYYRCGSFRNTLEVLSNDQERYEKVSVPMTTLDSLLAELEIKPDVIKIDVEGAEYLVLGGMDSTMMSQAEIYCEVHVDETEGGLASFGHSIDNVWNLFREHDYELWEIPLRKDSKQNEVRKLNVVSDIYESTMLYASKSQPVGSL